MLTDDERNRRNFSPHAEAVAAMWLFGKRYSQQNGGSMDFWDALPDGDKGLCRQMVRAIEAATLASSSAAREDAELLAWFETFTEHKLARIRADVKEGMCFIEAIDAARSATKGEGAG